MFHFNQKSIQKLVAASTLGLFLLMITTCNSIALASL
jgi:hypothetical protein